MRILKIIHGYPPRYNAGSEVYSQTLCAELSRRHEVHVFTREENLFAADGIVREGCDPLFPGIKLHIVNAARVGIDYRSDAIDRALNGVAQTVRPDVAHIGHLNHLSLGIVDALAEREIPVVYTLHDFWLMCLRGQFIQVATAEDGDVWPLCDGQENKKCADRCLRRFGGDDSAQAEHWRQWVAGRMAVVRRLVERVDMFVAPSKNLARKFEEYFHLPPAKIKYLDYGFDRRRLAGRNRAGGDGGKAFVFGYIGTHIPGKGVHHLLDAFRRLAAARDDCELRIWGRATANTEYLKDIVSAMPRAARARIQWPGEYANAGIVRDVFDHVDAVVVPSIWEENSPLVIHEAQQARLPVITAGMGGMAEYVAHEVNGLLFEPRNPVDLAAQMARLAANPGWARELGRRGYLYDDGGEVPDIGDHAVAMEALYQRVIDARDAAKVSVNTAPWRITFDTNPDHCNYRCTMCEEHSPHSPLQRERRAAGLGKRVMPFEVIARNVKMMAGNGLREIIPSTMGEPLLYKDFAKIISLCEETGVMMNLTTNGSFPKLGAKRWARLLVPVTSDIKISWNGTRRETHEAIMKNANWDDMLANVRTLVAVRDAHDAGGGNRCRLTFQMTFMESNSAELPDIIRLAASLGVDRVKGHHLWAHFGEIKGEDMRRNPDSVRRWNAIVDEAHKAADECRLPGGEQVQLDNIHPLDLNAADSFSGSCPFLGKEAWVSAEGRFNPCCAPDAERRTLGEFGNLHDTDLPQIWNSPAYRLLAKTYRSHAVCRKCNMRGRA